ncbi:MULTISPECIES: ABC transporter permease [Mesonia]|uniref:Teichoic acid translocation permease protein TagG n=1 Tax=Mesonia oceanica TaxID=2687242 RepID=A0AC61YAG4_9FLAO|nr:MULTISPECIES: ABC transporter permease [Mesonia]MAN26637.1 ABC transporter permease [Mesonia sp.]MAQ40086.1 ABC transporter permease [Mesonia sp.]MBJ96612.1 ABC transporter permease [Flavobacteriaceae bacterium]VVV01305.1 Teichoic acid translocation permease protein TagG [Mesonia oceanica]|tara:strand:- start:43647 stop:44504 length:858 start_codon:yes stop_codon:yes gene_type:complete
MSEHGKWLYEITPHKKLIDLNLKEIWRYRDLLLLFVKRDIVTVYKQTILGPLWFFIQPLFTSVIFTLVFNNVGGITTGGIPSFLFNLAGITAWNYFRECLTKTSNVFTGNANIFGKVYFPRAVMPLSITISNLLKFGIQLLIFIGFYVYYLAIGKEVQPNGNLILFPVYVLMMALMGLGLGMTISAFTTKYRDLTVLVTFAVQLLMYVSAVPFPLSTAKEKLPHFVWVFEYNPITQIIEGFRYMTLDFGTFTWGGFFYALVFSVVIFLIGLVIFNRTEKNFIDTV